MAPEMRQVAVNNGEVMDSHALHPENEPPFTLSKQQLRQRHVCTTDEEDISPPRADKESRKHKSKAHHFRKLSGASDDGTGGHGFLPGLMKKVGFGSQEFKEKDMHASDLHRGSGSHGFLPGLFKRANFGSQEFKEDLIAGDHHDPPVKRSGSTGFLSGLMRKSPSFGSQEFSDSSDHHGDHHHHHRHGTRKKEIFGAEDAEENAREHGDLFGTRDMENPKNVEKANILFGFEDKEFETGEHGRDLFGSDDPNTQSYRRRNFDIVGPAEEDQNELDRTRHIFGDENSEDISDVGEDDEPVPTVKPPHIEQTPNDYVRQLHRID